MKYRVERERTDQGYGLYWVVLDPVGLVVLVTFSQPRAFKRACEFAIGAGL